MPARRRPTVRSTLTDRDAAAERLLRAVRKRNVDTPGVLAENIDSFVEGFLGPIRRKIVEAEENRRAGQRNQSVRP
jgi:hypothetical protein